MTTICLTLPVMIDPFCCTELETITAMNCGTACGGFEPLLGWLVQVLPHVSIVFPFSNPLKSFGPGPPLIGLFLDHCEPQKFTVTPPLRFARSPTTNCPPTGYPNGVQRSPTPSPFVSR